MKLNDQQTNIEDTCLQPKTSLFFKSHGIECEKKNGSEVIQLPKPKLSPSGLFVIFYNLVLFGLFLIPFVFYSDEISYPTNKQEFADLISISPVLIISLLFLIIPSLALYVTLRRKHNCVLELSNTGLSVDTGTAYLKYSMDITIYYHQFTNIKRRRFRVSPQDVFKTRLIRIGKTTYLRVMYEGKYIDVATNTTNNVREALYHYIYDFYEEKSEPQEPQIG